MAIMLFYGIVMDFYLWNEELYDDDYVNTDDFYDFLDE